jgi:acyl carrier protein
MTEYTLSNLIETIDKCLGNGEGAEVTVESLDTRFADLGYDSLAVYELMTRLQDDTGVTITDDEIELIETPRQALDFVTSRLSGQAS